MKKSPEKFNPFSSEYKKVEDLPENEQDNFRDVEGGFVRKEILEYEQDLLESDRRPLLEKVLKKHDIGSLAHERAFIIDEYEEKLKDLIREEREKLEEKNKQLNEKEERFKDLEEDLEKEINLRNKLAEKLVSFESEETKKVLTELVKEKEEDMEMARKLEENLNIDYKDKELLKGLNEVEEIKAEVVATSSHEGNKYFNEFREGNDYKKYQKIKEEREALEKSVAIFEKGKKDVPKNLIKELEQKQENEKRLLDKFGEKNKNKILVYDFRLPDRSFGGEADKIKGFLENMKEINMSNILFIFASCNNEKECRGRCDSAREFIYDEVIPVVKRYAEELDEQNSNTEKIHFFKKSITGDWFENIEREAKEFEDEYKNILGPDYVVQFLAKKLNLEEEDVSNILRDFTIKTELSSSEKKTEEQKKISSILEELSIDDNFRINSDIFSYLLLDKFLKNEISYKDFIDKIKNVDSELSEDVLDKLRESQLSE